MRSKKILLLLLIASSFGFSWPSTWFTSSTEESSTDKSATTVTTAKVRKASSSSKETDDSTTKETTPSKSKKSKSTSSKSPSWVKNEVQVLKTQAANIDSNVLRLALTAYMNAQKKGYANKHLLTVIDYSKPSSQRRFWVFDLNKNKALFNTWVSHGKNSGVLNSTSFSNSPGSLKSSIGVFVTDQTYNGKNGYSLRLRGLERGVNDSAYARAIVIHGAAYANPANIAKKGRMGLSWGCPAVGSTLAKPIINAIKEKSVVFAYYPDQKWLSHSSFLSA